MSESGPMREPTPASENSVEKVMMLYRELGHIFDQADIEDRHIEVIEASRKKFTKLERQIEELEGSAENRVVVASLLDELARLKHNLLVFINAAERSNQITEDAVAWSERLGRADSDDEVTRIAKAYKTEHPPVD